MKVVVLAPLSSAALSSIAAVDHRLEVIDAWELFVPEIVAEWPAHSVNWYLKASDRSEPDSAEKAEQRDALLRDADVLCLTFPFPLRIVSRAPRLRFVHQLPAGVSNLTRGDLWQSPVPVTSGRAAGNTLAIAEWVIAAMLALARQFPVAFSQQTAGALDRSTFPRGWLVSGKTMGVVGLGGIGHNVARLAHGLGMRVVGSRRSAEPVDHVEQVYPPEQLHEMLRRSDVVVLATQLTHDTHHLLDEQAFNELPRGAYVINVARGELIDESALTQALDSGRVGGFAADVYVGEFDRPPPHELLNRHNVILTPHISGHAGRPSAGAVKLFCENLRRCLDHKPLLNLVDWSRGY